MGFDEFGVISFVPYSKVSEFLTFLKDGVLRGMRCTECDIFYFPPRSDCPECLGNDMEWVDTKGEGTLITYTTIHAAPTGFEDMVPYSIGLVDLGEGGRVLAWLEGMEETDIEIGMKLRAVPKKLDEDRITYQLEKL
jgi:uncharacterized OB-fold protein